MNDKKKEVKQPRIRRQHRQKITKENLAPDMNAHHLKISGATAVNRITGKRLSDIALPLMYCNAVIRAVTQCVIIASVSEIQEKEVLPVVNLMSTCVAADTGHDVLMGISLPLGNDFILPADVLLLEVPMQLTELAAQILNSLHRVHIYHAFLLMLIPIHYNKCPSL